MNKFLYLLFLAAFCFSCNENTTTKTPPSAPETPVEAVAPPKPQKTTYKPKSQHYQPGDQTSQAYPFDIALTNGKGEATNSSKAFQQNGKPTVLLFWLTTCVPCRYEMKAIDEKYSDWAKETDFNFYAISTDWEKNYEAFKTTVAKNDWGWETYHDTNRAFRNIMPGQLNGLPQTFVLDKDGKIAYHKRKYSTGDEDKLYAKVKELSK